MSPERISLDVIKVKGVRVSFEGTGSFKEFLVLSLNHPSHAIFALMTTPSGRVVIAECVDGQVENVGKVASLDGERRFMGPRVYRRSIGIEQPPAEKILGKVEVEGGEVYLLKWSEQDGVGIWDEVLDPTAIR